MQKDTRDALRERPKQATVAYFEGRKFKVDERLRVGEQSSGMEIHEISAMEASAIITYLFENDYIDEKGNILPSYHEDLKNGQLAPMGKKLRVTQLKYVVTTGEQGENETDFTGRQTTRTQQMRDVSARLPYATMR